MRAFIARSSLVFPNRDNPSGRWGVPYLRFVTAMRQEVQLADSLRALRASLSGTSDKTLLHAVLEAKSQAEVHAAICTALGLKSPSPEMQTGLQRFSRYLLRLRRAHASAQVRASNDALAAVTRALST